MSNSFQGMPRPKNGRFYRVLSVHRISTEHQDIRSLDDQEQRCREWVRDNLEAPSGFPAEIESIKSRGSGERLDRVELADIQDALESGEYDLVIAEDLGRICRRNAAIALCEIGEDSGTRVVAINDSLDTLDEGWRLHAMFASFRHEQYNTDTAKRIKRSLRNRFLQGGVFQCPIYGYLKPHPGATDSEVTKDPTAEPIIREIFVRLEAGASYAEVADWLNLSQIPPGPYVRSDKWNGKLVGDLVHSSILKGVRERNRRISKRVNSTGRRKSVKAPPEELLERDVLHLAFIEPARYDRIIRDLDARNECYRRKGNNGRDSRANVPKKRTRFPGQQVTCGICGHPFVWGGHGQIQHLMCKGAKEYRCWQGTTIDGDLATQMITAAVHREIESLPGFEESLIQEVEREFALLANSRRSELKDVEAKLQDLDRQMERFMQLIRSSREGSGAELLMKELDRIADAQANLTRQRDHILSRPDRAPRLPTVDEIKDRAREMVSRHADNPFEFSRVMRQLIPRIMAYPIRLCDGGKIMIRAKMDLHLVAIFPDLAEIPSIDQVLTRSITVDLFEPTQRDRFREIVVMLREAGLKERDVAFELGITQPAVQYAMKLHRRVQALELPEPYVPVTDPPADLTKLRRHLHPRYEFRPLPGFEPPS